MRSLPRGVLPAIVLLISVCVAAKAQAISATAQIAEVASSSLQPSSHDTLTDAVPEAPLPQQLTAQPEERPNSVPDRQSGPLEPTGPVTFKERIRLQIHTTLGFPAFMIPAYESAITMAHPPDHFPREWRDGGGAFGRNYGGEFARHATSGLTHFTTAAVLREDPRYYPSLSTNYFHRSVHAILFTLMDRSDSGHRTVAFSNLTGATAGGFITMTYMPDGFNDTTHAYQRAALELGQFGGRNLVAEFSPEISHILHKLHFSDRIADSLLPDKPNQP